MQKKWQKVIGFILSIMALVLFMVYRNDVRCLLIRKSKQFQKININSTMQIYASRDTPDDTLHLLLKFVKQAQINNAHFWQGKQNKAVVIYCHKPKLFSKYGGGNIQVQALTRLGTYIIIPPHGLHLGAISHELCHTELFARLGKNYWVYYQKLPCWFDEGLALQFNNGGIYSATAMDTVQRRSISKLQAIDRPNGFYKGRVQQVLNNYQVAKKEIEMWLSEHSRADLFKVIEGLKNGDHFYEIYNIKPREQ